MSEPGDVVPVADVPEDGTLLVHLRRDGTETEAILVRDGDAVRAFENVCQHWTDVPLDDGDGATLRDGEVVCEKHGATFDLGDGTCTFGPCEGAVLPSVPVAVEDGSVVFTDPDDEYLGRGPASSDAHVGDEGEAVTDLSSSRGLGF